ncbi:hypothetical protein [Paenibacillus sanguinis]|uniref:hypothetical protein n=1 Tax=Paenibacillus sanguinis TaxID=225906 RepID=UPI00036C8A3C|nr:hypothetical protein [Paenibacillus sanguinis]
MNADNALLLNRVFTRNTLRDIVEREYSDAYAMAVERYVEDPAGKNNRQLIHDIYSVLKREYRNEYFYKNTILNNVAYLKPDDEPFSSDHLYYRQDGYSGFADTPSLVMSILKQALPHTR